MDNANTKIISEFRILSNQISYQEIAEILEQKPNKHWIKDQPLEIKGKKLKIKPETNAWILTIENESISLEEELKQMLGKLKSLKQKIFILRKNKGNKINIQFFFAVYIFGTTPSVSISSDLIEEINDYQAALEIDIYN